MQWPAGIDAGISCHQKVGIFDFYATFSELIGHEVAESEAEDSASFLPAFKGETIHEEKRWALIHHSIDGAFAIRKGPWKLCRCPGSGGWAHPNDQEAIEQNLPSVQLYHMDLDPGEQDNVYRDHPDLVEDLTRELHRCVVSGRSTPGSHQSNCEEVVLEHWEQINWLPEIPEAYVLDD
jgi:arylsulfatase A-like enzyme